MNQPFNLNWGKGVKITHHFIGYNSLNSVLFPRISTIGKGTLHLFRYNVHINLTKTIREFQNFVKFLLL